MNAIFVVFACLSNGQDCRPHVMSDAMPLHQCVAGPTAQVELLDWMKQHPKHRMFKFACVDPKRLQAYLGRHQA